MKKIRQEELFGGQNSLQYNILMNAFEECAADDEQTTYDWVESKPITSMVVHLVDKINEMGFEIKRK